MTLILIFILLLSFVLIATERLTNINKSAIAVFAGTVGWVLYVCYGNDYVMSEHPTEYFDFLSGAMPNSTAVKEYIASNVFLKYVGQASEIVLFLLATMTIVEILDNNGCFDFINHLLRTRRSRKMLWTLAVVTFVISANLDNVTTTVMMLTMMHRIVANRRQRMLFGSVIVLSATCGGALTVIGDPTGLVLWNIGAVEATSYSMTLLLPCLIAWALPVWLIGRSLPERIDCQWMAMPYRGDDTRLKPWQRLMMLFVGIGGLWFIPSFHNITKLSPFLGALCVLSVLWVVNEIVNHKLINSEQMTQKRRPQVLKYGTLQMILFVMGIMLALGVVRETGILNAVDGLLATTVHSHWVTGLVAGLMSTVLDSFASAMTLFSLHGIERPEMLSELGTAYLDGYQLNGVYWKIIAYCTAMGGSLLAVGSASGLALLKMERMHVGWYFRNVGWKALLGAMAGLAALYVITSF